MTKPYEIAVEFKTETGAFERLKRRTKITIQTFGKAYSGLM